MSSIAWFIKSYPALRSLRLFVSGVITNSPVPKRFKKVYIEISNVCNLQCTFCPEVQRGKKFMGPELFRKVAAAVAPLTEAVCFHLMGEPLLHPRFEEYVGFCGLLGLPVHLTTNGV